MAATVRIWGSEATCDGYRWTSRNRDLQRVLNAMLDPLGPSGADPDPDATAAYQAVAALDGEIVRLDPPPPFDPDVVY